MCVGLEPVVLELFREKKCSEPGKRVLPKLKVLQARMRVQKAGSSRLCHPRTRSLSRAMRSWWKPRQFIRKERASQQGSTLETCSGRTGARVQPALFLRMISYSSALHRGTGSLACCLLSSSCFHLLPLFCHKSEMAFLLRKITVRVLSQSMKNESFRDSSPLRRVINRENKLFLKVIEAEFE